MSFIAPILRTGIRSVGKYVYQGLRQQDRIIDYTYRKTGLYNRGVVRGVKHGLAGGQIVGGVASLGLSAEDSPGNSGQIFKKTRPKADKSYQARRRFARRFGSRRCGYYPRTSTKYRYSRAGTTRRM